MENKYFSLLWSNFDRIMNNLASPGILLGTGDGKGKENIMTIGWAQIGIMWNQPAVSIMVRPSRYSFDLLLKNDEFTFNVLSEKYKNEIGFCGSNSGLYCDKFKETNLSQLFSHKISVTGVKESDIVLECKVSHFSEIIPEHLNDIILTKHYGSGDYHTIFTGVILNYKIS